MAISKLTLTAIQCEGFKQDLKWGEQNGDPTEWLAILVEEVGELAQAILADRSTTPELHDSHHVSMEMEAIQIAAVAAHFIEYLSRRKIAHDTAALAAGGEG
jgi:NTP pyrophosphatase (non-canonical NTP hydrolase)